MMDRIVTKDGSIIEESIRRGDRFGRMLVAVREGATPKQMAEMFPGIDAGTYGVLRAILNDTISRGQQSLFKHTANTASKIEARKRGVFRLFDAGYTNLEVTGRTGLTRRYVSHMRSLWDAQREEG